MNKIFYGEECGRYLYVSKEGGGGNTGGYNGFCEGRRKIKNERKVGREN